MKNILSDKNIKYIYKLELAIKNADAIVLITPWQEYKNLFSKFTNINVPIIDCRRVLDKFSNINYYGVGIE